MRTANMIYGNARVRTSPEKNRIVDGKFIHISGMKYAFVGFEYWLNDRIFTIAYQELTLVASDPTNGRIDGICVNSSGQGVANIGTPAAEPVKPDPDPATQIEFTFVIIPANATQPEGITDVIIFDENTAGEFTPSATGVTVNFNDNSNTYNGVINADVGAIGTNDTIRFTAEAPLLHEDYENLIQVIKLKAAATTKHQLFARFLLAGNPVSNEIAVPFSVSDITNKQVLVLSLSAFTWSNAQFDAVQYRWNKTGTQADFTGFYLDYIKLQTGVVQPVVADTVELTGDVIASGKTGTPIPATLKTVNANVGQFGSATKSVTITVDGKGRILAVTENDIQGGGGIPDAPADGQKYARKDNSWVIVLDGEDGQTIELSTSGGYAVWRYVGEVSWNQWFPLPQDGDDGREVELSTSGGYVVWRYVGEVTWNNLYQIPTAGTKPVQVTGLTLLAANWVTDGSLKKYVLSHASITATSIVEVIPENAAYDILVAAEPRPGTESATGSVSMWVKNTPTGDINVIINIYETV